MHWILIRRLKRLQKQSSPDRRFRRALKHTLLRQIRTPWHAYVLKPLAAAVTVCVLLSSTGVYAYWSDSVLPSHALYGVRQAIEKAETIIVSSDSHALARVSLKHLERRVREIEEMDKRGMHVDIPDIERVTQAIECSIEAGNELAEDDSTEHDADVQDIEIRSTMTFQRIAEQFPDEDEKETFQNQIEEHSKKLGRKTWKLDPARRERFESITVRYAAELFDLDWELQEHEVLVCEGDGCSKKEDHADSAEDEQEAFVVAVPIEQPVKTEPEEIRPVSQPVPVQEQAPEPVSAQAPVVASEPQPEPEDEPQPETDLEPSTEPDTASTTTGVVIFGGAGSVIGQVITTDVSGATSTIMAKTATSTAQEDETDQEIIRKYYWLYDEFQRRKSED